MNDELEKAYEADKERKSVKSDELQAARDYVGVLLDEAEGRNAQLEDKKQEADELLERLYKKEEEMDALIKVAESEKKKNRLATFWMCFALAELLMIVVFAIVLIVNSGSLYRNPNTVLNRESNTDKGQSPDTDIVQEETPSTVKYSDDLAERVRALKAQDMYPFRASVEKVDGLEYLVFTSGNISVGYKNEYNPEESKYRKCMIVDNGLERYVSERSYDLKGDLMNLVPTFTTINDRRMLAFIEYNSRVAVNIPSAVKIIDCGNFRSYFCYNLSDMIRNLTVVAESEELSVYDDAPIVYTLTTAKAAYKYAVSEGYYNDIAYNEAAIPDIDTDFSITISEEGISWITNVKLGDEFYLGQLTGNIGVSEAGIGVSGAKFGAFVPANQEDPELEGFIRPASSVPAEFLTIGGNNGERYYIAVNDDIPPCSYDWTRLNRDDANNWYYTDENGEKISVRGIDVSKYQGNIDWKKVADAGVEFAIIRVGFRGMNQGTLEADEYFVRNIANATANGIKVGIYFFSQAITEKEAVQEAEYVLNAISKYTVEYPVIIDTERVTTYDARANSLSVADRTKVCRAFCDRIAQAGYKPMLYANTKYMVMGIDQTQLEDIDKWFAVYSDNITYPYDFQILQYSESGSIPGISGNVDLNISFMDYSAQQ